MEIMVNIHTHHPALGELTPRTEGIHPWRAELWDGSPLCPTSECEAVGEIGLDYACKVNSECQQRLFLHQLRVAEERGLPVILHCVRAFEPTMQLLRSHRLRAVIFHGFIGSKEQAERATQAGYYLAFGERSLASPRTCEVMQRIPLERLFVESDESRTPITEIYERVAKVLGVSVTKLQNQTLENFKRIFR